MLKSKQNPTNRVSHENTFCHSFVANQSTYAMQNTKNLSQVSYNAKNINSQEFTTSYLSYNVNTQNQKDKEREKLNSTQNRLSSAQNRVSSAQNRLPSAQNRLSSTQVQLLEKQKQSLKKAILEQKAKNQQIRRQISDNEKQYMRKLADTKTQIEELKIKYQGYQNQMKQLEQEAMKLEL